MKQKEMTNVSGVKNTRRGYYNGNVYLFTHRNPENNKVWSDDILDKDVEGNYVSGKWVPAEEVKFID